MRKYTFLSLGILLFVSCNKNNKSYSFSGRVYDLSGNTNFEGLEIEVDYVSFADDCKHSAGVAAKVMVKKDGYFKGTHKTARECSVGYLSPVMKFKWLGMEYYSFDWARASGLDRFSKEWDNVDINVSSLGIANATIKLNNWKKGDTVYYKAGYNFNNGSLSSEPVKSIIPDSSNIVISYKSNSAITGLTYNSLKPTPYLYIGYNQSCLYNRNGEMVPKDSILLPQLAPEPAVTKLSFTY